jgi:hypothetical protein
MEFIDNGYKMVQPRDIRGGIEFGFHDIKTRGKGDGHIYTRHTSFLSSENEIKNKNHT